MLIDPLALISMEIPKAISATVSSVDTLLYKSHVSMSSTDELEIKTIKEESDDEEEIFDDEMAHSYKVMYKKPVGVVIEKEGYLNKSRY